MYKLLLSLFLCITLAGCSAAGQTAGEDYLLHTTCTITVYEKGQEDVIDGAFVLARDLENQLSRTVDTSDLSAISSGSATIVQESTLECLDMALDLCQQSEGALDITMGGVSDLWDFGSGAPILPDSALIAQESSHVSYENVVIDGENSTVTLLESGAVLDLGAVAKGYIVDAVTDYLVAEGVTSALVNFGGTMSAIGDKYGQDFSIGLQQPFYPDDDIGDSQLAGLVPLADQTMVTAGTYQQCFIQDNQLYHHILDPKTGYPADTDLASVTIFAENATIGDGLSTACIVLGYEKAVAFLQTFDDVEAIFILKNGEIVTTPGVNFTPSNPSADDND